MSPSISPSPATNRGPRGSAAGVEQRYESRLSAAPRRFCLPRRGVLQRDAGVQNRLPFASKPSAKGSPATASRGLARTSASRFSDTAISSSATVSRMRASRTSDPENVAGLDGRLNRLAVAFQHDGDLTLVGTVEVSEFG